MYFIIKTFIIMKKFTLKLKKKKKSNGKDEDEDYPAKNCKRITKVFFFCFV